MQIMDVGEYSRTYKDPTQEIRRNGGHLFTLHLLRVAPLLSSYTFSSPSFSLPPSALPSTRSCTLARVLSVFLSLSLFPYAPLRPLPPPVWLHSCLYIGSRRSKSEPSLSLASTPLRLGNRPIVAEIAWALRMMTMGGSSDGAGAVLTLPSPRGSGRTKLPI